MSVLQLQEGASKGADPAYQEAMEYRLLRSTAALGLNPANSG